MGECMKLTVIGLLAAAQLALPMAAHATVNGLTWQAQSTIIGQTSTATQAPPTPPGTRGDPIYYANPLYSGVVQLLMNEGAAGSFLCTGTLLPDRQSILTAGHCVSHGAGTANPISTTAYFNTLANPDSVVYQDPTSTAITVSKYFVNPGYTGNVIDDNDIAVLRLSQLAPAYAASYDIYDGGDLTGQDYNVAGYGVRSDQGGSIGADLGAGRLRQGDNRYDFRLGDSDFGGYFSSADFGPTGEDTYTFLSDFDNGLAQNDASCQLAVNGFGLAPSSKYCDLGLGALEVSTAPGDSGGPQFIDGKIASVTSFGLTFGANFGDVDNNLNDTFGEFNGFVPTFIHTAFIRSAEAASVPEPGTWMQMIVGFGVLGGSVRLRGGRTLAA